VAQLTAGAPQQVTVRLRSGLTVWTWLTAVRRFAQLQKS
jgi:hypothetical protein